MNNCDELIELYEDNNEYKISEIACTEDSKGERIDKYLSAQEGITRSAAAKLVEDQRVTVDGKYISKNYKLRGDENIIVNYPQMVDCEAIPQNIPVDIVYEDDDIIVVNKPSGMVVHPAAGNQDGTLVNALLYHCGESLSGIGGVVRPGIVHRIDKDTSGLLVVAKNDEAHLSLSEQLKTHSVSRVYYAILCGKPRNETGTIDAPIGRHPSDRKKMAVIKGADRQKNAKNAVTHYTVLERFHGFTLVKCELETGRTHQIRVHMSSIGHPILGDGVYGGDKNKFFQSNRSLMLGQCLHAKELELKHPKNNEYMHFYCELPSEMEKVLEKLRRMQ